MTRPVYLKLLVIYMLVMTGVTLGAQIGYTAGDAGEASVEYNGTHVVTGTGSVIELHTSANESSVGDPAWGDGLNRAIPTHDALKPYARSLVDRMLQTMFALVFSVASATAPLFFQLSAYVSEGVTSAAIQLAAWLAFIPLLISIKRRVQILLS